MLTFPQNYKEKKELVNYLSNLKASFKSDLNKIINFPLSGHLKKDKNLEKIINSAKKKYEAISINDRFLLSWFMDFTHENLLYNQGLKPRLNPKFFIEFDIISPHSQINQKIKPKIDYKLKKEMEATTDFKFTENQIRKHQNLTKEYMEENGIEIKIRKSYIREILTYAYEDKIKRFILEFNARLKHWDSLSQKAFVLICEQYLNKKIRAEADKIETNYKDIVDIADRKAVRIITKKKSDIIPTVEKIAESCGQKLDKNMILPAATYRKDDKYWYFIKQTKPYLNIGNFSSAKKNYYQTYHIIGDFFGEPIETQVRSKYMDIIAEAKEESAASWATYKKKNRKIIENILKEKPESRYILNLFHDIFKGIE